MVMMNDKEYISTRYDKEVDLNPAEIEYLKKKDLYSYR